MFEISKTKMMKKNVSSLKFVLDIDELLSAFKCFVLCECAPIILVVISSVLKNKRVIKTYRCGHDGVTDWNKDEEDKGVQSEGRS